MWIESQDEANLEHRAGPGRGFHHPLAVLVGHRQRLFDEDRQATLERREFHFSMSRLGGDDVDGVQRFARNHLLEVRVPARHVVPLGDPGHRLWTWVADRREFHAL
ncbi:MAG: hypothetical protein K0R44_3806, partial [Thermomicrobiales bacterium]|nr:hypothetical protein [Thermomicrobiales bacterium]